MAKQDGGLGPGGGDGAGKGATSDLALSRIDVPLTVEDCLTEIARLQSELRLSAAALVTSQEMERKRMASELHDSIGQALNAMSFNIRLAIDQLRKGDIGATGRTLDSLNEQVRDTIDESRRIALNLRPAMLDDLGVIGTLSWFFRQVRSLHPSLDLHVQIEAEEADIPDALRTPIYRVVQEAISNVVKHSGATAIKVMLHTSARRVELQVADNGGGFVVPSDFAQLSGTAASCGLGGMSNRVEFSGGKFNLSSKPGKGTTIKAVWPLRKEPTR